MYEASMLVGKHTKRLQGNRRQTEGHVKNLSRYCYGGEWCLLKPCESYEGGGDDVEGEAALSRLFAYPVWRRCFTPIVRDRHVRLTRNGLARVLFTVGMVAYLK
jgi:hypothetical protein